MLLSFVLEATQSMAGRCLAERDGWYCTYISSFTYKQRYRFQPEILESQEFEHPPPEELVSQYISRAALT